MKKIYYKGFKLKMTSLKRMDGKMLIKTSSIHRQKDGECGLWDCKRREVVWRYLDPRLLVDVAHTGCGHKVGRRRVGVRRVQSSGVHVDVLRTGKRKRGVEAEGWSENDLQPVPEGDICSVLFPHMSVWCVGRSRWMDHDWTTLRLERTTLIELLGFYCARFSKLDMAFTVRLSFTHAPFVCVREGVRAAKWD